MNFMAAEEQIKKKKFQVVMVSGFYYFRKKALATKSKRIANFCDTSNWILAQSWFSQGVWKHLRTFFRAARTKMK